MISIICDLSLAIDTPSELIRGTLVKHIFSIRREPRRLQRAGAQRTRGAGQCHHPRARHRLGAQETLPVIAAFGGDGGALNLVLDSTAMVDAIREMPKPMRQLALAMLCQWYAMFCYWQYITFAVGRTIYDTADPASAAFREATLTTQQAGALYNFMAFLGALALIPVVKRLGARHTHAVCLAASGAAMLLIPSAATPLALFALMLGIGIGWAGMMGNTYVMLADCIPEGGEPSRVDFVLHARGLGADACKVASVAEVAMVTPCPPRAWSAWPCVTNARGTGREGSTQASAGTMWMPHGSGRIQEKGALMRQLNKKGAEEVPLPRPR